MVSATKAVTSCDLHLKRKSRRFVAQRLSRSTALTRITVAASTGSDGVKLEKRVLRRKHLEQACASANCPLFTSVTVSFPINASEDVCLRILVVVISHCMITFDMYYESSIVHFYVMHSRVRTSDIVQDLHKGGTLCDKKEEAPRRTNEIQ